MASTSTATAFATADVDGDGYDDLTNGWAIYRGGPDGPDDRSTWRSFGLRGSVWVFHGGPDGVGLPAEVAPADAGFGHALAEAAVGPVPRTPPTAAAPATTCGCATTRPAPLGLAALLLCARARRRR